MGVKDFLLLFRTLSLCSGTRPAGLSEASRLLPKDNSASQKFPYGKGYGDERCDVYTRGSSAKEPMDTQPTSTKDRLYPTTRCSNLLIPLIKYLMFMSNFAFAVLGLSILCIGIWGLIDKQSLIGDQIGYLGTDPMLFFIIIGLVVFVLSLSGCIGFLRENACLLRFYSAGMCALIVLQSISAIVLLSFREQIRDSVKRSMIVAVSRYQDDSDLKFIMDEMQLGMECCGVESYQDWGMNLYFNCSSTGVLSCGVPYSCCIDPLENGTVPNSQCGFKALEMGETTAGSTVYLGGCAPQLSLWLSRHFWDIAAGFLLVITIELISVSCAQRILGEVKQIKSMWLSMNQNQEQ
uniref:Tetraspanin-10 n=1 Tax=Leptobrachium leishanense TaxID=445787 RepID=A0A8C5WM80_9ANUR